MVRHVVGKERCVYGPPPPPSQPKRKIDNPNKTISNENGEREKAEEILLDAKGR